MIVYEHNSWKSRGARLWKRAFDIFGPHLTLRRLFNLALVRAQYARRRPHVAGRPFMMYMEVSSICNLRCPGCLAHDPTYHARLMPFDEFRPILDRFAPNLVDLELYGWGEPFLNRDVFRMIRYAKRRNLFVRTSSNFNRFRPGDHERIVRSGLDQINASIDGTTQEVYSRYRVGASLDVAVGASPPSKQALAST